MIVLSQEDRKHLRAGAVHIIQGDNTMKKNLITTATTIIASAMIFLSASPVTAFATNTVSASLPKSAATTTTTVTDPTSITKKQALQIALEHAGYNSKDILYSSVKKDLDDGVEVYEVEFRVGFCEYNYDIAVADGQILEYEIDD